MAVAQQRFSPSWFGYTALAIVGLWITAASMSSGFIWASQGKIVHVYVAGFFAWAGYIIAHYGAIGVFIDDISAAEAVEGDDDGESVLDRVRRIIVEEPLRVLGFLAGIAVLVSGIAILAWFVRLENHLLGTIGSGLFLIGYVIAHQFDSGLPL
ncbi:MAG: hypothetical protein ABEH64_07210 [Salinirussus sp.]